MTSLLDIAPIGEDVEIDGKAIKVRGLSVSEIAHLLARFPHLRRVFDGAEADLAQVLTLIGDAVGPVIAAGTGNFGKAEEELAAASLGPETAVALIEPILRLTMPKGVGPFVEKLRGMGRLLGAQPS